ncbi:TPA: class I SAM-dependent methyltransferase [Candidatus Poribacteria bacterium]|nr:class I SAM-dependent methyltransferase [Candidatus Poribacteria bacterium]
MTDEERVKLQMWRHKWEERALIGDWVAAHGYKFSDEYPPEQVYGYMVKDVIAKLEVNEKDDLLEVGCATGRLSYEMSKIAHSVVGIDFSERMIRRAVETYGEYDLRFYVAEAAALPFPDNSFDKVLCYSVFHDFPSRSYGDKALSEILRVCRPGGVILIGDIPTLETWRYDTRDLDLIHRFKARLGLIPSLRRPYDLIKYGLLKRRRRGVSWIYYSRSFLTRRLKGRVNEFDFLDQNIPGKDYHRIDLKIRR